MLKDLNKSELIISTSDRRYGKLGHLLNKYSWDDLVTGNGKSMYYYIPEELVLKDYKTYYIKVQRNPDYEYEGFAYNWVNCQHLLRILKCCCNITTQDYYDLFYLHINNRSSRPRCLYCHGIINFQAINLGYGQFCCTSCSSSYIGLHLDDYGIVRNTAPMINSTHSIEGEIKSHQGLYISLSDSESDFYVARTLDGMKFGISNNYLNRYKQRKGIYLSIHRILRSNSPEIAYLESHLKLKFEGREYIISEEIPKFFKLLKELLANRPVANPFD